MQSMSLSKIEQSDINKQSGGDEKDKYAPEEVMPTKSPLIKGILKIFCDIESAQDEM